MLERGVVRSVFFAPGRQRPGIGERLTGKVENEAIKQGL